jgi:hypothetical protein
VRWNKPALNRCGRRLMTGNATIVVMVAGLLLMSEISAEAKPKSSRMCGGGCTCDRLKEAAQVDRIAYDACAAKIDQGTLGNGPKYHFECAGGGIWCCPDGDGTCFNVSRVTSNPPRQFPPKQQPSMTPVPIAPLPSPGAR